MVYQVYPRSFADSDDDGIGDLGGVIGKLDYLAALGIDVLWLSPFFPSPQDDNGYDISDYQDVDPTFGTLADLDELLRRAHDHGIRVILDLVVNHTSDEHPWFVESRSSTTSPKRDWYWWRPARDGGPPNNWQSAFSGSAWELDEASGEYFLHLFSRKQPDLNWENPEVRQAIHSMMNWWLDRGVDGFRMDVINLISKVPGLPDGPLIAGGPLGDPWDGVVCGPRIHEFLQEMHRSVFAGRASTLLNVGEMPGVTVEEAVLFTDPARAEVDMVFQFEHVTMGPDKWGGTPASISALKASLGRWQVGLAEVGWNSLYLSNHDQPRPVSRFGSDDPRWRVASACALATVVHLHRGTPYVYQGDEIGMTNAPFGSIEDYRDIESLNHFAHAVGVGQAPDDVLEILRGVSRDNARTPMQWSTDPHAGFTTGSPWLGVNPNYVEVNAEAAMADPDSVWHHYRRLIALRHSEPVVALGDFTMLLPDHPTVYAFTRRLDDVVLTVVANLSSFPVDLDLTVGGEPLFATGGPGTDPAHLEPWEARVHRAGQGSGAARPTSPVTGVLVGSA